MYFLSKLSKSSVSFVNQVSGAGDNRSKAFAIAISYVLARRMALPPEEVEEISMYYRIHHAQALLYHLDSVNDCMPFDTRVARKLTEDFFTFRYKAANPAAIPLAFQKESAVADFFGLSTVFSKDILEEIAECPEKLTQLVNGLNSLFDDLQLHQVNDSKSFADNQETDHYVFS